MIELRPDFNWQDARRLAQTNRPELKELIKVLDQESSYHTKISVVMALFSASLITLTIPTNILYPGGWAAIPGTIATLASLATIYKIFYICYIRRKIKNDENDICHPFLRSIINKTGYYTIHTQEVQMTNVRAPLPIIEDSPALLPRVI